MVEEGYRACPFCGEQIRTAAIKCRFCGEMLNGSPTTSRVQAATAPKPAPKPRSSSLGSLLVLGLLIGVFYVVYKVQHGSSVATAISGPETIADETVGLDEGEGRVHTLALNRDRRIRVSVQASPKQVNVWLMTDEQYAEYSRVHGQLRGTFHYQPSLSIEGALAWEREALLPAGRYNLVIERPHESLVLTEKTSAHIVIQGL